MLSSVNKRGRERGRWLPISDNTSLSQTWTTVTVLYLHVEKWKFHKILFELAQHIYKCFSQSIFVLVLSSFGLISPIKLCLTLYETSQSNRLPVFLLQLEPAAKLLTYHQKWSIASISPFQTLSLNPFVLLIQTSQKATSYIDQQHFFLCSPFAVFACSAIIFMSYRLLLLLCCLHSRRSS